MIADTWFLLILRRQIAWNSFTRQSVSRRLLFLLGAIWLAGSVITVSALIGYGAGALLHQFPNAALDSLLPGAILTAVVLILLLTSFGLALGSLFLSSDLDLLMTAPVDRRAVFLSKLLDGMTVSYGILLITAVPALVTYGLGLQYGPLYFVLVLVAVLGTPLLPEGLGALLVMLVARFAPARRVREVLALVAALFGISASLLGQTSRLWMPRLDAAHPDLAAFRDRIEAIANLPIPSLVAGRGLAAAGRGNLGEAAIGLAGFLVLTFGFFALCVWAADSMYATGWVRMQSAGAAKRSARRAAHEAATGGLLGRASAALAVTLKDWRMIPRDLRNFSQVLGPAVLLPVIYFNLLGGGGERSFNPAEATSQLIGGHIDPAGIFVAAGVLTACVLICSQVASTAISMEGSSWWLLKAAPISGEELARGKFVSAWVPYVVLTSVLMVGAAIWRGFDILGFLYGWFGVELLGAGMLAMALGFGMRWPRLAWTNPKQMHSGWATFASSLGELVVGVLGGGLLCLPVLAQAFVPTLLLPAWIVGIAGAVAVTGALAYAVLQIGLNHLPDVGEA